MANNLCNLIKDKVGVGKQSIPFQQLKPFALNQVINTKVVNDHPVLLTLKPSQSDSKSICIMFIIFVNIIRLLRLDTRSIYSDSRDLYHRLYILNEYSFSLIGPTQLTIFFFPLFPTPTSTKLLPKVDSEGFGTSSGKYRNYSGSNTLHSAPVITNRLIIFIS